ncbi:ABC transporter permease [Dyella choica]|uniref:FtsX-like permease family protein n=1 Tax=Dyella choica TaxID=1927959 RepID=A0A3S0PJU7_9GAMM|nr:FtsX-like permease family protein [Dyella choica]RUL69175.1 FtsX-like permease family protein [Dyella choica]
MQVALRQFLSLAAMSIRSLPSRTSSSIVAVVGFAVTGSVLVAVLALAGGLSGFWQSTGSDDVAIVLARSSFSEVDSRIARDAAALIEQAPGLLPSRRSALSPQLVTATVLPRAADGKGANVLVRGFDGAAIGIDSPISILEGRSFQHGLDEVIVGEKLASMLSGVKVGGSLQLGESRFKVTGIFQEQGGGRYESEIWGDTHQLASAMGEAGKFSAIYVKLAGKDDFAGFADYLDKQPGLEVKVFRERDYLDQQAGRFRALVLIPGLAIVTVMAFAAMLAAANTMLSAIQVRLKELATLRAIGFGPVIVAAQVLAEALALGLLGGVAGALAAAGLLHGESALTSNGFSAMALSLSVRPGAALAAIGMVLVCALLAGAWPAILMSRMGIADALRKT